MALEILRKFRNIVTYFHHSIPLTQKLKHNSIGKKCKLQQEVPSRWYTIPHMLTGIYKVSENIFFYWFY
jgi:hypothetical protein